MTVQTKESNRMVIVAKSVYEGHEIVIEAEDGAVTKIQFLIRTLPADRAASAVDYWLLPHDNTLQALRNLQTLIDEAISEAEFKDLR